MNHVHEVSAATTTSLRWWRVLLSLVLSVVLSLLFELAASSVREQRFSVALALPDLSFFAFMAILSALWFGIRTASRGWARTRQRPAQMAEGAPERSA